MELYGRAAIFVALFTSSVKGCELPCSKGNHSAVCGYSPTLQRYKDFNNPCDIERANHCGGEDWTLIHSGACTGPEKGGGCPTVCQPVCGHSHTHGFKSFISKCLLDIETLISDYKFSHDGPCSPLEVPPSSCPVVCTSIYTPVCGYSPYSGYYKTFSSACVLRAENKCNYGTYSLRHSGPCTDEELKSNCKKFKCSTQPEQYQPVCGHSSDRGFKTFYNLCFFYNENGCPVNKNYSDYKLIHNGPCSTQEIGSFCKPGFCPEYGEPVCASSLPFYRTFPTRCHYYVENSCKFGDYKLEHPGECTKSERDKSCNSRCLGGFGNTSSTPVCAYSLYGGYRTFETVCFVKYENTCSGSDYNVVHLGACSKGELELICGKDYCRQYKSSRKVCGLSKAKGYKTFENKCFLYSENTCKRGDYKLAHYNECTNKETEMLCKPEFCNSPGIPVCGYNKKDGSYFTFLNLCLLYKENICNGKDYTLKHNEKCSDHELGGKCPVKCYEEVACVCGYSKKLGFKTFQNKCKLDAENACYSGDYRIYYQGECSKKDLEKNCQRVCPYIYQLVCGFWPGKGSKTFGNMCLLDRENACYGSAYKPVDNAVCKADEGKPPSPGCGSAVCTKEYNPICAYSKSNDTFQTFPTKCVFDYQNKCLYKNDFIFVHKGACEKGEIDNNCQWKCSEEISPVCGVSPTQGHRTFKNPCKLVYGRSCCRSDFSFAYDGKCSSKEVPVCEYRCPRISGPPLCAFSLSKKVYETFPGKCLIEYENRCTYGDWIVVHDGKCSDQELKNDCLRTCNATQAPVCGYSHTGGYKTFQNRCVFARQISCNNCDYVFSHEGKCKYPEGPQKGCPVKCDQVKEPVCGYSRHTQQFKTFWNKCLLDAFNRCKYGDYIFVHKGECTKGELGGKCYLKCPLVYKPVCGYHIKNGYRTFPNHCSLEIANKCKGAGYSLAHEGKCTRPELNGACNHLCFYNYNATCAYSKIKGEFKTFANECFLDKENHCTFSDYIVKHPGKCTKHETGGKCHCDCDSIYAPVCAYSPTDKYKYKTFPTFCHMDQQNSCNYKDYNVIHEGECFSWELCENCKKH